VSADAATAASTATTLIALRHANLLPVLDAGIQDGWAFVVQPPLPAPSLDERLRIGALTPPVAGRALSELAAALATLHARGLVHGDVRPANIGFDTDGRAVLGGFAVGRSDSDLPEPALPYLAPERRAGPPTPATDQFALAATLVSMLTGSPPFRSTGSPALAEFGLPSTVGDAVGRALAPSPADRYPDVTTFAETYRAAVVAGSQAMVAGVWEALERNDIPMATMLVEGALRLQPDDPEIIAVLNHVRERALTGGTPDLTALSLDMPVTPPPAATEPWRPPPIPQPPARPAGSNPWILFVIVLLIGLLALIGLAAIFLSQQ
jgi:serine/threonine-protein kinase